MSGGDWMANYKANVKLMEYIKKTPGFNPRVVSISGDMNATSLSDEVKK